MTEETLFHLALQQPAAERAAFLEKMCAGDEALRQRVAALLHAAENPGDFLGPPPVKLETTVDEAPPEGPGSRVGPYKLLQQIGEGGMGTVFLAEQQEPVRRMVAVKVIKPGMDTHQVVARFEAERQALALMDHPNIARVLDAGTTGSGRPYFVMELVKGVPLTKYCDEHRLSPKGRLELFVPICRAVQHAHQKGIIHRDLKPSNVLVALYDSKPVPKVIDFGVAKATGQKLTDKTLFTGFGGMVGTLEYMSPEQAEMNQLDVDTRADIYSLGVLLYELLTGTTPLERKRVREVAILELLRLIREEEPPKPSTRLSTAETAAAVAANRGLEPKKLSGLVRGDLDWIVMKCLEKDRDRRYETANGLAADVQRYLSDEPVLASPPSAAYRLRKFARRHKAGLMTTATIMGIVLLAVGGVSWALWEQAAQRQTQRTERAGRVAETDREVSIALAKAEQSVNRAEKLPCRTSVEAKAALVEWREAAAALAEAEAAQKTGTATDGLRERVAAMSQRIEHGRAQALRKDTLFRDLDNASMTTAVLVEGNFDFAAGAARYAAAFTAYGLEMQPELTDELIRQIGAEDAAVRDALIVALDDWAYCAAVAKTAPSAKELASIADRVDQDLWRRKLRAARTSKDRAALLELSAEARQLSVSPSSLVLLGRSLGHNGERDEALAVLRWGRSHYPTDFWLPFELGTRLQVENGATPVEVEEAIGCYRGVLALRPESQAAHNNLGVALAAKNQLDDAIAEYQKVIEIDPKLAPAHNNLGLALWAKNQLDDAIAEYQKAIEIDPKYAWAHNNLGLALHAKNQLDDAIAEFKKAIEIDPKLAKAHNNLGIAFAAKKQWDDAIAEFKKAIEVNTKFAEAHNRLGLALFVKNQLDDAIAEFKKAIEFDPKHAKAHNNLGIAFAAKKQWDDAIAEFKKAIEIDPKFAMAHNRLGLALRAKNQLDDAIAEFKKAIEIDSKNVLFQNDLDNALKAKKQLDETIAKYRKAIDLNRKNASAHFFLGNALCERGSLDEAVLAYREAIQLDGNHVGAAVFNLARLLKAKGDADGAFACLHQAIQLYRDAGAADPKLADADRYNAICCAALAAALQGTDPDKLDNQERTRLRKHAHDWLRADLNLWSKRLEGGKPEDRKVVQGTLQHWRDDAALAGVRDAAALKKLPAAEQEAWRKLWTDVADLLKKAGDAK